MNADVEAVGIIDSVTLLKMQLRVTSGQWRC